MYLILILFGSIKTYLRIRELNREDFTNILRSNSLPEITFLVTAYNESHHIVSAIKNLAHLSYRYKKIIIINDGSTDNTMETLQQALELTPIPCFYEDKLPTKPIRGIYRSGIHPEVIVIDKENGKKFDALNAGLNACNTAYFITADADTFIDNSSFEAIIRPILTSPETVAAGASVRLRNGCSLSYNRISTIGFPQNFISAVQSIEYLRAFLMRQAWEYTGGHYLLSGAFAMFSTDLVVKLGGYAPTVAEDLEIVFRIHRVLKNTNIPYKITYLPDPVAWTEGPSTFKALTRQRINWHRGLLESMWFHRCLFCNSKYGGFGLFVYPFLFFGEAIEPLVETLGYLFIITGIILGVVNPIFILLFMGITIGFTFIFTLFCLLIEELSFRKYPSLKSIVMLLVYSLVENFGYRQLTLIWRLQGFRSFYKRYAEIKRDSHNVNESITQALKKFVNKGETS